MAASAGMFHLKIDGEVLALTKTKARLEGRARERFREEEED